MFIHKQRAHLSAMIGVLTHVFILLGLSLPLIGETSGWETINAFPLPGLFLASIFCPLLLYLGSVWILFQQEKRWLALQSLGAIGSMLLAFLGLAYFLPELLFLALTGRASIGYRPSGGLGLAFLLLPLAFFISFCCSLLLVIHLSRMRSITKKAG